MWNGSAGPTLGDSLSPYIFILCLNHLSHMFHLALYNHHLTPIFVGRH